LSKRGIPPFGKRRLGGNFRGCPDNYGTLNKFGMRERNFNARENISVTGSTAAGGNLGPISNRAGMLMPEGINHGGWWQPPRQPMKFGW
jgi:hypothetical protein